jgi:predicted transcriptional regulator
MGWAMSAFDAKRTVLFSIRPFYANKILAGQKTVELRRRFPEVGMSGSTAMIYCTSPVKAIVGSAQIRDVHKLPLSRLWRSHGGAACIAKDDFNEYFSGQDHGYAIILTGAKTLKSRLTASDLEAEFGIVPPQSYRYLTEECVALLNDGRLQASSRHKHSHRAGGPAAR